MKLNEFEQNCLLTKISCRIKELPLPNSILSQKDYVIIDWC